MTMVWPTTVALLSTAALILSGCSSFSKSSREQRAYQKYVRKSMGARAKQRSRLRPSKSEMPPPQEESAPVETTETAPESMPPEGSP